MKKHSFTEAGQNLSSILEEAKREGRERFFGLKCRDALAKLSIYAFYRQSHSQN